MTSPSPARRPSDLLLDALEAAEDTELQVTYWDRQTGEIDCGAQELAEALTAAGWEPPPRVRLLIAAELRAFASAVYVGRPLLPDTGPLARVIAGLRGRANELDGGETS